MPEIHNNKIREYVRTCVLRSNFTVRSAECIKWMQGYYEVTVISPVMQIQFETNVYVFVAESNNGASVIVYNPKMFSRQETYRWYWVYEGEIKLVEENHTGGDCMRHLFD